MGQQRRLAANSYMQLTLARIGAEIDRLTREGHTVIGVDVSERRPTIQLAASPVLSAMADEEHAAYAMRGTDAQGHFRKGQLLGRDILCVWIERGH